MAGKINVCCFDKTGTLTEDGLDVLGVRGLERNMHQFGELLEDIHDLPLAREKATFLHALASCHSLKMVNGEVIGDPLDVKMFEFTRWTLEEGRVAGTGNIKAKGAIIEQTALVQTVVRPPGSAQFRLEDALKGASRVCAPKMIPGIRANLLQACPFSRTRGHPYFRFCLLSSEDERRCQATQEQQHGNLCQGRAGSYGRYL